jgi:hypothetical protein
VRKLHPIQCHRATNPHRKGDWFLTETPPEEWIPGAVVVMHLAIWSGRKWVRKRNYAPTTARLVKGTPGNGWLYEAVTGAKDQQPCLPGPWRVIPPHETAGWGWCVADAAGVLCSMRGPKTPAAQKEALARLIAAVPDLLFHLRATADVLVARADAITDEAESHWLRTRAGVIHMIVEKALGGGATP